MKHRTAIQLQAALVRASLELNGEKYEEAEQARRDIAQAYHSLTCTHEDLWDPGERPHPNHVVKLEPVGDEPARLAHYGALPAGFYAVEGIIDGEWEFITWMVYHDNAWHVLTEDSPERLYFSKVDHREEAAQVYVGVQQAIAYDEMMVRNAR